MMFSLLFTKSITDLVEWLESNNKHHHLFERLSVEYN